MNDTQIVATVLSADGEFPVSMLASVGASAALHISDIPFYGPVASVQVGRVDGQWVANPSPSQLERSDLDVIVAGTRQGILMVEGESKFISEADMLAALKFGHQSLEPLLNAQDELREKTGSKAKMSFEVKKINETFRMEAESALRPVLERALKTKDKGERYQLFEEAKNFVQVID
jgi:polyribonucleotide nucleotidyltransferase